MENNQEEKSSYEKINYSLRPAKAVERKMFCDSLFKLNHFNNIKEYQYVGFGSTYFSDFSLFHKTLGLKKMISIEVDAKRKDRFEFNRPYSCIKTIFKHSNDALVNDIDWDIPTILWVDYDYKLNTSMLTDIQTFFSNAKPSSLFMITIDIKPDEPKGKKLKPKELKKYRVKKLERRVTRVKLPNNIDKRSLGIHGKSGNIETVHEIINDEIQDILNSRNGILKESEKLKYQQIYNIYYNDGTPMLTLGGIIYSENQQPKLNKAKFGDLDFVRYGSEAFTIEIPSLTFKEINSLDKLLPENVNLDTGKIDPAIISENRLPELNEDDIKKYAKLYRYFPTFAETNF